MMKKITVLALSLLPVLTFGQNTWTLKECIDYAIENNITVKQSALQVQQRDIALSTAKNSMLPGLSASGSQNFSFGRGLTSDNTYANTNTTNTSLSLGASMPLFEGLRIKNNITLSELNLQAATEDLAKAKDDIRTAVAAAFVQVLYNNEILGVAHRQVEIDSLQVGRLEAMARSGKASQAEVSAQKSSLAQSRLTEVQAEGNLKVSILDLTQLLELPSPDGFNISLPDASQLEIHLLQDPQFIYETALGIKPQIKSEQLRVDAADASIRVAKASYYPSLSLSGGLGSNYYTNNLTPSKAFFEQLGNNFSQYVGLSLNIPIFQKFAVRNNVRSAQVSLAQQQLQLESVKKALYKEIQQAHTNALTSQSKYERSKAAAVAAKEAFELMEAKYENGKANITEFNASKAQYLEAESNLTQARYEYLYQTKLLDFYQGKELTL